MLTVTIGGVERRVRFGSLSIHATLNGRDRLDAALAILDGRPVPATGAEIIVVEDAVRIFGGFLDTHTESAITPDGSKDLLVNLGATDFNELADRRYVPNLTAAAGMTVKAALEALLPYLPGVTLHPAQVDGPTLPALSWVYLTVAKILDEISTMTQFIWEIDYSKFLRAKPPGGEVAPFPITDANRQAMGDITVEPGAVEYANRIIVRAGPNAPQDVNDFFSSDGVSNAHVAQYPLIKHYGWVGRVDAVMTLGEPGSGAEWIYTPDPPTITRPAGPYPAGTAFQFFYNAQFPLIAVANDAAAQAARGIHERLVDEPDVMVAGQAQAIADGLLPKHATPQKVVRYATRGKGLVPGQLQGLSIVRRGLAGDYFITDVETRMHSQGEFLVRSVTCQEAVLYQYGWRDLYKLWSSGSGSGGGGGGSAGGGTQAPVVVTPAYYLGASSVEWVQANPATWTPASAIQVQPRGLTAGQVTVRLRARAGSVTARLQDLTDGTTAGTSSPVTSTALVTVRFGVALTEGHTYELQLLPSLVDTDVQGIGYLA